MTRAEEMFARGFSEKCAAAKQDPEKVAKSCTTACEPEGTSPLSWIERKKKEWAEAKKNKVAKKTAASVYADAFTRECMAEGVDPVALMKQAQDLAGMYNKYIGSNMGRGWAKTKGWLSGAAEGGLDTGAASRGAAEADKRWQAESTAQRNLGDAQLQRTSANWKGLGKDLTSIVAAPASYLGGFVGGGHRAGMDAMRQRAGAGDQARAQGTAGIEAAEAAYQKATGRAAPKGLPMGGAMLGPMGIPLNYAERGLTALGSNQGMGRVARGLGGMALGGIPGMIASQLMPKPQPGVPMGHLNSGIKTPGPRFNPAVAGGPQLMQARKTPISNTVPAQPPAPGGGVMAGTGIPAKTVAAPGSGNYFTDAPALQPMKPGQVMAGATGPR